MAFNSINESYCVHERGENEYFAGPLHNIRLVYIRENHVGAKLYVDPSNTFAVKLENAPTIRNHMLRLDSKRTGM